MEKKKIGIRLRKNPLKSKDKSPYLATVVPNGKVGLDEILAEVAEKTHSSKETARLCWDAMMELINEELAQGHKVNTPCGRIAGEGRGDPDGTRHGRREWGCPLRGFP